MWVSEETLADFQERIEQLEASNRIRAANLAIVSERWAISELKAAVLKGAAYRRFNEAIAAVSRISNELQQEIHDGQAD